MNHQETEDMSGTIKFVQTLKQISSKIVQRINPSAIYFKQVFNTMKRKEFTDLLCLFTFNFLLYCIQFAHLLSNKNPCPFTLLL